MQQTKTSTNLLILTLEVQTSEPRLKYEDSMKHVVEGISNTRNETCQIYIPPEQINKYSHRKRVFK